jgi:hypothetical protein
MISQGTIAMKRAHSETPSPPWGEGRTAHTLCATLSALVLATALFATAALADDPSPGAPKAKSTGGSSSAKTPAQKSGGSLDEDLFGNLTDGLFEGLDKPKFDNPPEKQAAPAKESAKPAEKIGAKTADKTASGRDTLLDEFGAGEDIGQESNPLLDLGQRMRHIESLISRGSTGNPTQRMQDDVVKDLEKMIELKKKSCPICNSCNSQGQKNSNTAKSGQPKNGKGTGDFKPNPRAKDSELGVRKDKVKQAKTDSMLAAEKEVWGLLPERVQEAIRNAQSSKFISEYSTEVKDYFTRLAELYQEQQQK